MPTWTDTLTWIRDHQTVFQTLGLISLALLVISLVVFPLVVINLPRDYFVREKRDPARQIRRYPLLWWGFTVLKNILGLTLILAGIAMLVLPGQGLLTILIGTALTNFPGKFRLERHLVSQQAVAGALNRIRVAAGRAPLTLPAEGDV
jgi:hypothetical protein